MVRTSSSRSCSDKSITPDKGVHLGRVQAGATSNFVAAKFAAPDQIVDGLGRYAEDLGSFSA